MNILSRTKICLFALLLLAATASKSALAQGTPSYADQSFLEDIFQSDQLQIQASQMAPDKAYSGDVKEFSKNAITVQTQLTAQLTPLGKQMQVSPNQKPSKKERKELAQLAQLSGTNFDTAYVQLMAKAQQRILKEFKSEGSGPNPTMQKLVKDDGPVLTQNYQVLLKIADSHNIPLAK